MGMSAHGLLRSVRERQDATAAAMKVMEGRVVERLADDVISAAYGDGVLVDLTVRRGRVTERLRPEDLGLEPSAETEARLREAAILGSKLLLPREIVARLKAVEQAGRTALRRRAFATLFGHFVPCTAYAAWKADYERLRAEFHAVRDDAVARHAEIVEGMRALWLDLAPRLYREAHQGADPPDGHAETVADRMAGLVLPPERIAAAFQFDQRVRLVPIPSEAEADMLTQDRLRRERRLGAERAALVEDFERDVGAVYADRRATVQAFAADVQTQLAQHVARTCQDIHAALDGRRAIPTKTAERLRRLLDDVGTLNFVDDPATIRRVADVRAAVEAADVSAGSLAMALEAVHRSTLEDLRTVERDESWDLVWRLDDKAVA